MKTSLCSFLVCFMAFATSSRAQDISERLRSANSFYIGMSKKDFEAKVMQAESWNPGAGLSPTADFKWHETQSSNYVQLHFVNHIGECKYKSMLLEIGKR